MEWKRLLNHRIVLGIDIDHEAVWTGGRKNKGDQYRTIEGGMRGAPHMEPSFPLSPVDSYTASAPCLAPRAPSRGVISSGSTLV